MCTLLLVPTISIGSGSSSETKICYIIMPLPTVQTSLKEDLCSYREALYPKETCRLRKHTNTVSQVYSFRRWHHKQRLNFHYNSFFWRPRNRRVLQVLVLLLTLNLGFGRLNDTNQQNNKIINHTLLGTCFYFHVCILPTQLVLSEVSSSIWQSTNICIPEQPFTNSKTHYLKWK